MSHETVSPRKFAEDWYSEEQIHEWLNRPMNPLESRASLADRKAPHDVTSREFSKWFREHLVRAMTKGIQFGEARGMPEETSE